LRRIGRVIHISPGRKAVVKAEKTPKIGENVFDDEQRRIGRVFDVFGPTVSPYVEVEAEAIDAQTLVGNMLYFPSSSRRNKWRKKK
jgi:RNA-binding protein